MIAGIDLSLRSTGIAINGQEFHLIKTNENLNDVELLEYISDSVIEYLKHKNLSRINLEGLSFGSISGSKDIIAGNFWHLKCRLTQEFGNIVRIVPVLSWRSPLFSKEERKVMKHYACLAKDAEKRSKERAQYKQLSDIKYNTWLKLPEQVKTLINNITTDNSRFDLTDAYWLSLHLK